MIPIAKPIMGREEIKAVVDVLKSGSLTQGKNVETFEKQFSSFIGTKHGIACSSGTAALQVGIEAAGVREGDEVITTPFTFIASANAIVYNRAKPIFADIDAGTFNIDPGKIREKITHKTKAVVVVHLYGQPCDMAPIQELCKEKDLLLIEDACQAHGAEYRGKKAGSFGILSAFSFYATKNMMTGEGGMMLTDDDGTAEKARIIINQGQANRYEHVMIGYNDRMTDMQAAIGIAQLRRLEAMNSKREKNARFLTRMLRPLGWIETPFVSRDVKHAWHQYTIKVPAGMRDDFMGYLNSKGIGARVYYPRPVHMQPVYHSMGYREGLCPVAEAVSKQVLSLPVHPQLKKTELEEIVETIEKYRAV